MAQYIKTEEGYKPVNELAEAIPPMAPATADEDGLPGLVPAPAAGQQDMVLHGDGTWRAVEELYENLYEVTEDVESFEVDFLDANGEQQLLKKAVLIQHFKSINAGGADPYINVLFDDGGTASIIVGNNYANNAGNWVSSAVSLEIIGKTIYCLSNKSVGASTSYAGGIVKSGAIYPLAGWGDRWAESNRARRPIGFTGVKIPGALGAKSQLYVGGVRA